MLERREACPVCGGASLDPFRASNFPTDSIEPDDIKITDKAYGSVWDLERCRDCTHVFANPCPTPEFIRSLYAEIVDPQYQEESEGREKNFERILNYLEKCLPDKGPLFDVGAATGILLNMARERGWRHQNCIVLLDRDGGGLKRQLAYRYFPCFVIVDVTDQQKILAASSFTTALLDLICDQILIANLAPY